MKKIILISLALLSAYSGKAQNNALSNIIIDSRLSDTIGIWSDLCKMQKIKSFPMQDVKTAFADIVVATVRYYGFDAKLHEGIILVHKDLKKEIEDVFAEMLRATFPIEKVVPANKFPIKANGDGWDDETVMSANVTSCFNFRYKTNGKDLSLHALGRAIDINPLYNPYEMKTDKGKQILPKTATYIPNQKGTITDATVVKFFEKRAWTWGGRWGNPIDYQHFQKSTQAMASKVMLLKNNVLKDNFYEDEAQKKILFFENKAAKDKYLTDKVFGDSTFCIYDSEKPLFVAITKHLSNTQVKAILLQKKDTVLTEQWLQQHGIQLPNTNLLSIKKGIKGKKIALDPGHFADNTMEAMIEQKFIGDSSGKVLFYESDLAYATAILIKKELEAQGAEVLITRLRGKSTLGITLTEYLFKNGIDTTGFSTKNNFVEYKKDVQNLKYAPIRRKFNSEDLDKRQSIVNTFKPDLTLMIHFNTSNENSNKDGNINDVKNNNYNMVFLSGAFGLDDSGNSELKTIDNRIDFARLLYTNDITESKQFAQQIISSFRRFIPASAIIPNTWQTIESNYLENACIGTEIEGVYHRNLFLTRRVRGALCYGETLFQNNIAESKRLNQQKDKTKNKRIKQVAKAYSSAIIKYFDKE